MTDAKVEKALEAYQEGKSTAEVAELLGYSDRTGVSQLMRRNGYRYDRAQGTYVSGNGQVQSDAGGNNSCDLELSDEARQLLQNGDTIRVLKRAGEVLKLLDDQSLGSLAETLSSPLLRSNGETKVKSYRFPKLLVNRVEEFAEKTRLHQRQIFEAALVEFLKRRGGVTG